MPTFRILYSSEVWCGCGDNKLCPVFNLSPRLIRELKPWHSANLSSVTAPDLQNCHVTSSSIIVTLCWQVPGPERRQREVQHRDGAEEREHEQRGDPQPQEGHRVRVLPDALLQDAGGAALQLHARPDPGGCALCAPRLRGGDHTQLIISTISTISTLSAGADVERHGCPGVAVPAAAPAP